MVPTLPVSHARRKASTSRVGNGGLFDPERLSTTTNTTAAIATTTTSAMRLRSRQNRRRGLSVNVSPTGRYCARAPQPGRRHPAQLQEWAGRGKIEHVLQDAEARCT